MEEKAKRSIQIKLPSDTHLNSESALNDLDDLVGPMTDALQYQGEHEESEELEYLQQENTNEDDEEEYEMKSEKELPDEIPKEDFFEAKEVKEEKYGEIEGMVETDEEEDQEIMQAKEDFYRRSLHAQRLSVTAQKFAENIADEIKERKESQLRKLSESDSDERPESDRQVRVTIVDTSEKEPSTSGTELESQEVAESEEVPPAQPVAIDLSQMKSSHGSRGSVVSKADMDARLSGYSVEKHSIYYDVESRHPASEGDLLEFFDLDRQDRLIMLDDIEQEAEEEEVKSAIEEESLALVREPYYQKYDACLEDIAIKKIKNNVLQKKVVMYLKRRKVDNFIKESEPPLDQINKYHQKLDTYKEVLEVNDSQRKMMSDELNNLKQKRAEHSSKLDKLFKAMQTREGNIGYGLIHTKTGNPIPDKLVERLIRRQKTQMEQVAFMRLKFIKLKGMVQEKLDSIDKLDQLENNLRLADYEQLKVENRNYADKIEERDEELTRLRAKCQNTIQILAHMREKSAALENDLYDLKLELSEVAADSESYRQNLADLKKQRDKYRNRIVQIKAESGLLTQPDLLWDMELSQIDITKMEEQLDACRDEVLSKITQVRNLRKNIERRTEILNKRRLAKLKGKPSSMMLLVGRSESRSIGSGTGKSVPTMYKRRPTLYMPTLKTGDFMDVVNVRPNPKTMTRRRR